MGTPRLRPLPHALAAFHLLLQLRMPGLYRWPVQLQLIEPAEVAMVLSPPEEYFATIDHGWCVSLGPSRALLSNIFWGTGLHQLVLPSIPEVLLGARVLGQ